MASKAELVKETSKELANCNPKTLTRINQLNKILVTLSASQLDYLIELSTLLFCQPPK